jgi:hypothetical protein
VPADECAGYPDAGQGEDPEDQQHGVDMVAEAGVIETGRDVVVGQH